MVFPFSHDLFSHFTCFVFSFSPESRLKNASLSSYLDRGTCVPRPKIHAYPDRGTHVSRSGYDNFQIFFRAFPDIFQSFFRCSSELFLMFFRAFPDIFQSFSRYFSGLYQIFFRAFSDDFCLFKKPLLISSSAPCVS